MLRKSILFCLIGALLFGLCGCNGKPGTNGGNELGNIEVYEEIYEPGLIETYYPVREHLYADYVVTRDFADPTGKVDATAGIQAILDQCANNGGGTVFLPRGIYRVTSNIHIPAYVYLQGDYNDPDGEDFNGYYGTVILADVEPAAEETRSQYLADRTDGYANFPALFTVGGSAGLTGVTVYYPEQDPNDVTPYPFAVEIPSFAGPDGGGGHHAATVRNLTLINAYKGICVSVTPDGGGKSAANEVLHLENIKGTALYQGMQLYNSSEVGVIRDVHFSNDYWFAAPEKYAEPDIDAINSFTRTYGTGMLLGDLEWDTYANIRVSGYKIGVRLYDGLRRFIEGQPEIYFIGQFYGLYVSDCDTALRVDDLYPNFGVNIAGGSLQGSVYAINDRYDGTSRIRLSGVKLSGAVYGDSVYTGSDAEYEALAAADALPESELAYPEKVFGVVYDAVEDFGANNLGATDTSVQIQSALDYAGQLGGGIVYLKAGFYRIKSPLNVPAGVELRGSASANTRDQNGLSKGTVIFGDAGYCDTEEEARTAQALITLADGAGVSGIRFIYPQNPPLLNNTVSFRWHSYVIRAAGEGCYAKYLSFNGVPFGIEFNAGKAVQTGYVIGVNGTFYRNALHAVGVENMLVEELLSNAAVMSRNDYKELFPLEFTIGWPVDGALMTKVYDEITRPYSILMDFENVGARVGNSFTFASNTVIRAADSEISVYNTAGDNMKLNGAIADLTDSDLVGVNIMRYQANMLVENGDCDSVMLNRLSLHMNTDNDWAHGSEVTIAQYLESNAPDVSDLPGIYKKG